MAKKIEELKKRAEKIVSQFENGYRYKQNLGIIKEAKKSVDYYEGRQWDDYIGKNQDELKPLLNQIRPIIQQKVSTICNKQYKINFSVDNDLASTKKLTKFTATILSDIKQALMNQKLATDSLVKGSAFQYLTWNEDKVGVMGQVEGGIESDFVDLANISFANPNDNNLQNQEWIIVRSRKTIKSVKENCSILTDKEKDELIVPKSKTQVYSKDYEQDHSEQCNVYTKFFRIDNEVYFEKCTDEVLFQEARSTNPLTTFKELKKVKDKEGLEEIEIDNKPLDFGELSEDKLNYTEEEKLDTQYKAHLYPFIRLVLEEREDSIYGLSYVYPMIADQRLINQALMTTAYGAGKSVTPNVLVKKGVFNTSGINLTKGGQILEVNAGLDTPFSSLVQQFQQPTMSTEHYSFAQSLTSFMKDTFRASDILDDGRNIASGMSGDAIANLNYLQDKPVAQLQERLAWFTADLGRLLEQFYKLYYRNKKFSYEMSTSELNEFISQNQDLVAQVGVDNITKTQPDVFNGDEYLNIPCHISVDVLETSKSSEESGLAIIQTLFLNGVISNMSTTDLLAFTELAPSTFFPQKDEFKRILMTRDNTKVMQLEQMAQQLAQQNEQLQAYIQQLMEQSKLKEESLKNEFTSKINEYNEVLRQLSVVNTPNQQNANKGQL